MSEGKPAVSPNSNIVYCRRQFNFLGIFGSKACCKFDNMSDSALVKSLEKFTQEIATARAATNIDATAAAIAIEVSSDFKLASSNSNDLNDGNQEIFDWVEEIIGSRFVDKGESFQLLEFELGSDDDEPTEEDLLRHELGEGMVIPLRVVFMLNNEKRSCHLVVRLPSYFYDLADNVPGTNRPEGKPILLNVYSHETYFYSVVVQDIKNFLQVQGLELSLAIPECYYVKHEPMYEARRTPALIENVMKTKTLLVLSDLKSEGFSELETIEDIGVQEAFAVMNEMGKLHAVTWCMEEKSGQKLKEMWPALLSVTDQAAIHQQVIDSCFEFFTTELDGENLDGENNKLLSQVCYSRPEIERLVRETLYSEGPNVPNSLLHMMIAGPNLYFRRNYTPEDKSNEFKDTASVDCSITGWGLATTGNPILDLALFTTISLTSSIRQKYTDALLDHYWQAFVTTASLFDMVPKVDIDYISREYEKFQIWPFLFLIATATAPSPSSSSEQDTNIKPDEIRDMMENIIRILKSSKDSKL